LTVGKLRDTYDDLLKDSGIQVPYLLKTADLAGKPDETPVDEETFIRFLKPDC